MCHLLIIEDEWLIVEQLTAIGEEAGATSIISAATESEAVQAAADRKPDIIFSDVNLLVGTGPSAVRTIISSLGPIPVIFITASPDECRRSVPAGVIMTKPIAERRLITMFRQMTLH